jgi:hypothetical protein
MVWRRLTTAALDTLYNGHADGACCADDAASEKRHHDPQVYAMLQGTKCPWYYDKKWSVDTVVVVELHHLRCLLD